MNNKRLQYYKKLCLYIVLAYLVFTCILPFFMGDSLYYRKSSENIDMPIATEGSIELVEGTTITQQFTSNVPILDRFSIQFGTLSRLNQGKIQIELVDLTTSKTLFTDIIDVSTISDYGLKEFALNEPYNQGYGHSYRITISGIDSQYGSAVIPLLSSTSGKDNLQLSINNTEIADKTLCFSSDGRVEIWTGKFYKQLIFIGLLIICFVLGFELYNIKYKNKSYIFCYVEAIKKYNFLIKQLVTRDFKTRYKRSVLGVLWSLLNPLLTMLVQYIVFSTMFKSSIQYYHIYLLIGVVTFNFFSEACNMCLMSIIGNTNLITKVYLPKYVYPLSKVLSSSVNFLISLIPLLLFVLITGLPIKRSFLLIIIPLLFLLVFSYGIGMLLASSMVFFRDTQFLWGVFSMLWMYATPLFYPVSILSEFMQKLIEFNPLYHFILCIRTCIINGVSPDPREYYICAFSALIAILIGGYVFKKSQDKFIYYL